MAHPDWYFKYYNQIFAKNKKYKYEIDLIDNKFPLKDKSVQEIGSGTGEHASQLLKKDIESLHLLDVDLESISILQNRFSDCKKVTISKQDGFDSKLKGKYDVVICMFSIILLDIEKTESLIKRIKVLLNRVKRTGYLFFEIVDCGVSKIIYPEKSISTIYTKNNEFVKIESRYLQNTFEYIYFGTLENQRINYKVSLFSTNVTTIRSIIESMEIEEYKIFYLESDERRCLISIRKQ